MATITGALNAQVLYEFKLPDHDGRDPLRPLYVAAGLFDWIDETNELYEKNWSSKSGGRSMAEHLSQTFCAFRCDARPLVGELNRVQPTKNGVWKIHSPGLRIYGWVPRAHAFVAVRAAFSENVHGPQSATKQLIKDVIAFAKVHNLYETFQRGDRSALFQTPA